MYSEVLSSPIRDACATSSTCRSRPGKKRSFHDICELGLSRPINCLNGHALEHGRVKASQIGRVYRALHTAGDDIFFIRFWRATRSFVRSLRTCAARSTCSGEAMSRPLDTMHPAGRLLRATAAIPNSRTFRVASQLEAHSAIWDSLSPIPW